jgi:hypothetical protein
VIFGSASLAGLFTDVLPHGKQVLNLVICVILALAFASAARNQPRNPSAAPVQKS